MAFTDLALVLLLEFRLVMFTPSFAQAFRARHNMRLILDITKAFFILNGMNKEAGNYEKLVERIKNTNDVKFELQ